ncbi:PP0621 family protein [Marinomonas ostreistagni]|uniref:PP0621 family protein n=1 Tax=Marinomonas ostreistagni TaxID=359209 RepID=UPI001951A787|nr:PP0621 family protein [Marinomonas ostreistagni]MBM6549676.1 hypothetical protein [Marinomonas ostreistagni]
MIVRLLLFILVFAVGWIIYRQFMKVLTSKSQTPAKKSEQPHEEAMVKCAHCGTFIPKNHAIYNHEQLPFCTLEHQQAQQKR